MSTKSPVVYHEDLLSGKKPLEHTVQGPVKGAACQQESSSVRSMLTTTHAHVSSTSCTCGPPGDGLQPTEAAGRFKGDAQRMAFQHLCVTRPPKVESHPAVAQWLPASQGGHPRHGGGAALHLQPLCGPEGPPRPLRLRAHRGRRQALLHPALRPNGASDSVRLYLLQS